LILISAIGGMPYCNGLRRRSLRPRGKYGRHRVFQAALGRAADAAERPTLSLGVNLFLQQFRVELETRSHWIGDTFAGGRGTRFTSLL